MCLESKELKLCTCFGNAVEAGNVWTLKRFKGIDWMDLEIGRCLSLSFGKQEEENIKFILDSLINSNPFDFEYIPENGDTLNINLEGKYTYEFTFRENKWESEQELLSIHLNKDRVIKKGIIIGNLNKSENEKNIK